jgi:hypothetical protein
MNSWRGPISQIFPMPAQRIRINRLLSWNMDELIWNNGLV